MGYFQWPTGRHGAMMASLAMIGLQWFYGYPCRMGDVNLWGSTILYKVDTQQWNEMGINDSFLQCQVHNGNHQIIGLVNYTVLIWAM